MWLVHLYQGRLDRINYFYGMIFLLGYIFLFLFLLSFLRSHIPSITIWLGILLLIIWYVFLVIFGFSLYTRRFHDFGRSGWWCLLYFVPLVNFFVGLTLLFIEGDPHENKYGKPLEHEVDIRTILAISQGETQQKSDQQSTTDQG